MIASARQMKKNNYMVKDGSMRDFHACREDRGRDGEAMKVRLVAIFGIHVSVCAIPTRGESATGEG